MARGTQDRLIGRDNPIQTCYGPPILLEGAMHFKYAIAVLTLGLLAAPTFAEDTTPPWQQAAALLQTVESDLQNGGLAALKSHVEEMKAALTKAKVGVLPAGDGTCFVLTDNPAETITALAMAPKVAKEAGFACTETTAVNNPYPRLSFYLGSYYNEIGYTQDAISVLDQGLTLYSIPGLISGQTAAMIYNEKIYSAMNLKLWDEILVLCDAALKLEDVPAEDRARTWRNRGYALVELDRLDEAEDAYHEALKVLPGDRKSIGELQYIKQQREKK